MNRVDTTRVRQTQSRLRQQAIIGILDEFDGELRGLEWDKRLTKYRKMAGSPFLFYRGSAYLFYFDVSREWFPYHTSPDRPTWIQGDLHFDNFGVFRSESGRIVFDVNDFDEGYAGSYLYDLLRMCVSLLLVGRANGAEADVQHETVDAYLSAYIKQMQRFVRRKDDPKSLVFDSDSVGGPIRKLLRKMEKRASSYLLEGLTVLTDEGRRFVWTEEIVPPTKEEAALLTEGWPDYWTSLNPDVRQSDSYYRIKDMAVKHGSGTASIGLDRFYMLLEGGGDRGAQDDIIVEAKEVRTPIPAYFMPYRDSFWEKYEHQGNRVIKTQQAMHHEADPLLGYMTLHGRHFYVRERSPFKKKLKPEKFETAEDWLSVAGTMGRITAKMHARADADVESDVWTHHSEDEIMRAIGSDTDGFRDYLARWATAYAYQVEEDFALFADWLGEREQAIGTSLS